MRPSYAGSAASISELKSAPYASLATAGFSHENLGFSHILLSKWGKLVLHDSAGKPHLATIPFAPFAGASFFPTCSYNSQEKHEPKDAA